MSLVLSNSILNIATEIGRLRRRYPDDASVERVAQYIDGLDAITFPSAAEMCAAFRDLEDEDDAAHRALHITDTRANTIRRILHIHDPYLGAA